MNESRILLNTGPSERGWHRIQDIVTCPRKYAFRCKLGVSETGKLPAPPVDAFAGLETAAEPPAVVAEDETPEALARGSLVHVGLAHYYAQMRAVQQGDDPGRYYDPLDAIGRAAAESFPSYQGVELCRDIVANYMMAYAGEQLKVLLVEEQVRGMVRGKWLFTQRYDRVVETPSGRVIIYDAKTAANVGPRTLLGYGLSGQLLAAEYLGRRIWGERFGGVRIDFVGTVPQEKLPFRYKFQRHGLAAAPYAVETVVDTIEWAEKTVEALEAGGVDPWKYPAAHHEHACMTRYGACPYYALCRWGPG